MEQQNARLDRVERDVEWLRDRQDKQADAFEQLRADLRADLRDTEARLSRRITDSHDEVVEKIDLVEQHLTAQDEVLRGEYRRDDDLIAARIDWPSWRKVALAVLTTVAGFAALHFGLHIG